MKKPWSYERARKTAKRQMAFHLYIVDSDPVEIVLIHAHPSCSESYACMPIHPDCIKRYYNSYYTASLLRPSTACINITIKFIQLYEAIANMYSFR